MTLSISHTTIKVEREDRFDVNTDKTIIIPEIDFTVEIGMFLIEVEEILTEIIDQILGVDHEIIIDKMIGETVIDKII